MEMICLIQDHLLRMRSVFANPEPRFELGDVVNEFKTFAAEKQISVLTDFHLNREAMKEIEKYNTKKSRIDVTQKLGKSNISESVMILNNVDVAIYINKDMDNDGQEYMAFGLQKMRDKTNVHYFAQPYCYGSNIKLKEDLNGAPVYKTSLRGDNDMGVQGVRTSSANALHMGMVVANLPNQDNAFEENSGYGSIQNDDDDDIIEPKFIKPAVISPFDTLPKLPDKAEEEHSAMIADILSELKPEVKIIKPLIFGDEAVGYF